MDIQILIATAASIGFFHTIIGPDHYLPFILMRRSRNWSFHKTVWVTTVCGIGHVLGSVILGFVGISLGLAVGFLESVEALRGDIASWLLIGFGTAYAVWGIRIGLRAGEHTHDHDHNGDYHHHSHHHLSHHTHLHGDPKKITPWALFIIFVLGPCEPLIPLLMYPAAQGSWWQVGLVTLSFGLTTVITMVLVVIFASKGMIHLRLGKFEKYTHALAGLIIALSGLSIKFLGL